MSEPLVRRTTRIVNPERGGRDTQNSPGPPGETRRQLGFLQKPTLWNLVDNMYVHTKVSVYTRETIRTYVCIPAQETC